MEASREVTLPNPKWRTGCLVPDRSGGFPQKTLRPVLGDEPPYLARSDPQFLSRLRGEDPSVLSQLAVVSSAASNNARHTKSTRPSLFQHLGGIADAIGHAVAPDHESVERGGTVTFRSNMEWSDEALNVSIKRPAVILMVTQYRTAPPEIAAQG